MGSGGGGGYAARLFILFSFPCSADHERGWPPCKVPGSFFGLATNTLNVRNNNMKRSSMTNKETIQYTNVLFTQAPICVCLHGTNIGSRTILVTMYYCG